MRSPKPSQCKDNTSPRPHFAQISSESVALASLHFDALHVSFSVAIRNTGIGCLAMAGVFVDVGAVGGLGKWSGWPLDVVGLLAEVLDCINGPFGRSLARPARPAATTLGDLTTLSGEH